MKNNGFEIGDIIVIGGDADDKVVKWAEFNGSHGLYTGFKVVEVINEEAFKVNGFDGVVTCDNLFNHFKNNAEFFEWVKYELEQTRSEEEMEMIENDFSDFIIG